MSNAVHAYGTTLTRDGNAIAEITNLGGPSLAADSLDVTSHDSSNGYREFIQGLRDGGELSIEGNFYPGDSNGQAGLLTDFNAGTVQSFVMTFPASTGTTWTFSAIVTAFETTAPVDDKMGFSATLKITGKPILATSASNNITALVLTTATLYPVFAATTYDYVAVSTGDTCTVTATFAAGTCTLTANGLDQELTSTVASSAISLGADGTRTVITLVVQETGKSAKTYTIDVANAAA